jgi:hypothetical protein
MRFGFVVPSAGLAVVIAWLPKKRLVLRDKAAGDYGVMVGR